MIDAEHAALPARTTNFRMLCRVLRQHGLRNHFHLAAAFGPSMTAERLALILAGGAMPDYLARSLEHIMCVPWRWLDERQGEVTEPAVGLLVERALRIELPLHTSEVAAVIVEPPLPLEV